MLPGEQRPKDAAWLAREVADLKREMQELRAARSLEAATLGAGGLVIKDGGEWRVLHDNGTELMAVRRNAAGAYVIILRRDDGSVAFEIQSLNPASNGQYWALKDRLGQIVVSDDAVTGDGMARPWLPIPFVRIDTAPPVNSGVGVTQSGSFVGVYEAFTNRTHPHVEARLYLSANADGVTTGEGRLMLDGVQVGSTITITAGAQTNVTIVSKRITVPLHQRVQLVYEIRRTAGLQNVFGKVDAWWRQS